MIGQTLKKQFKQCTSQSRNNWEMYQIKAVGNTSLQGTKELFLGRFYEKDLEDMKDMCEEIYLSNETDFQSIFMENMNFK